MEIIIERGDNTSKTYLLNIYGFNVESYERIVTVLNSGLNNFEDEMGEFNIIDEEDGTRSIEYSIPSDAVSVKFDRNNFINNFILDILNINGGEVKNNVHSYTSNFTFKPLLNRVEYNKTFLDTIIQFIKNQIDNLKYSDQFQKLNKLAELKNTNNLNTTISEKILHNNSWNWHNIFNPIKWILLILSLVIIVIYLIRKKFNSDFTSISISIIFISIIMMSG
jgi:hypothetical protein